MQERLSRLRALTAGGDLDRAHDTVGMTLAAIREHLKLDVAYVSEFVNDTAVFRSVDAPGLEHLLKVGDVHSLSDLYCRHIREGRLPELMSDTGAYPLASQLPITRALPIGAHVSVPISRPGRVSLRHVLLLRSSSRIAHSTNAISRSPRHSPT